MTDAKNNRLIADDFADALGVTLTDEQRVAWQGIENQERVKVRVQELEKERVKVARQANHLGTMTNAEFRTWCSEHAGFDPQV